MARASRCSRARVGRTSDSKHEKCFVLVLPRARWPNLDASMTGAIGKKGGELGGGFSPALTAPAAPGLAIALGARLRSAD